MFELKEITNDKICLRPDANIDDLYILWNKGTTQSITIDHSTFEITKNCILFLSEFHMSVEGEFENMRVIRFDKSFLGLDNSLNQAGDYLLIFYGYHFLDHVPKITLLDSECDAFEQIWDNLLEDFQTMNEPLSAQLVRNSFQRLMLQSQKIHTQTEFDLPIDFMELRIIREFQYLVETNFKQLHHVSDYSDILKISAKKISTLFHKYYNRKPSELIAHRRNLEAKKRLLYANEPVKSIAIDLNFADIQSFGHFFKKMNGLSPVKFRNGV